MRFQDIPRINPFNSVVWKRLGQLVKYTWYYKCRILNAYVTSSFIQNHSPWILLEKVSNMQRLWKDICTYRWIYRDIYIDFIDISCLLNLLEFSSTLVQSRKCHIMQINKRQSVIKRCLVRMRKYFS